MQKVGRRAVCKEYATQREKGYLGKKLTTKRSHLEETNCEENMTPERSGLGKK